jgi:hypothetical protein
MVLLEVTTGTVLVEGDAGKLTPFRLVNVQEVPSVQLTPLTVVTPLPGKSLVAMGPHSGAVAAPLEPVETKKFLVLEVLPPRRVGAPLPAP